MANKKNRHRKVPTKIAKKRRNRLFLRFKVALKFLGIKLNVKMYKLAA